MNAIAASLAKAYPKSDDGLKFELSHPGLAGNTLGRPTRAFVAGLMLLAGLILLAACANLGSLFAARAADRSREIAIRMALGSRRTFILRQLLTEALLVSVAGGICGMAAAVGILRMLSTWRPIPNIPINVPVNPDATTYVLALLLAIFSGLLFGLIPVRQVLRSDPWQVIRSGTTNAGRFAPLYVAGCAARVADRHLCCSGDFFARCGARFGAFAPEQLRHSAKGRDARKDRSAYGWI